MSVTILPFNTEHAPIFDRLNRAWIEEFFTVEPFDNEVLTQPEKLIIQPGGEVWFAALNGEVIGACALLTFADGIFEFTKLGVDAKARGTGVARALLTHAILRTKKRGAHTLKIFTSTRLAPAIALYRSVGFQEIAMTPDQRTRYKRADIMFDLPL